jgi:hypothetical protein
MTRSSSLSSVAVSCLVTDNSLATIRSSVRFSGRMIEQICSISRRDRSKSHRPILEDSVGYKTATAASSQDPVVKLIIDLVEPSGVILILEVV